MANGEISGQRNNTEKQFFVFLLRLKHLLLCNPVVKQTKNMVHLEIALQYCMSEKTEWFLFIFEQTDSAIERIEMH